MKKKIIILIAFAFTAQIAFSQECRFEGKIITSELMGKGSKIESVTYYKDGNSVCYIAYMKTRILSKNGILYSIDYSDARPTVSVMTTQNHDIQKQEQSSVNLEKEVINGHSCVVVEKNVERTAGLFTMKKTSKSWIDTSFCLENSESPSGKGLTVKKISTMEMNERKNTITSELVSVVECPVADSLFYLPDATEARYIYAGDVIAALKNPSDTALLKKIADVEPQQKSEWKHCTEIDDDTFTKSIKKDISVVDFSAVWCKPCKMLQPILDNMAYKYQKRAKFFTIDIDKSPKTAKQLGIKAVPIVIVFKHGVETGRIEGFYPDIEKQVEKFITEAETKK